MECSMQLSCVFYWCNVLILLHKVTRKLFYSACPMRYTVLDIHAKLCKRLIVSLRYKDWVVAETLGSLLLLGYCTLYYAFEQSIVGNILFACKANNCAKLRTTVVLIGKATQKFLHISL